MNNSFIKLYKNNFDLDYPIVKQGGLRRDFFDQSESGLAYNCQPMSIANSHGWEFLLPHDVRVIWDGVIDDNLGHTQILEGEFYNGEKIVSVDSGMGTVSFDFNCFIETDKDHYCILQQSPNSEYKDVYPLSAVWRSDYFNYHPLFFCWKITEPNKEIVFKKGTPVMFMMNYPIGLLENTDIYFEKADENFMNNFKKYIRKRSAFFQENPQDEYPRKNTNFYKKGIGPNDEKFLYKPWKLVLKEPK
jgi:hypothetical protein